MSKQTMLAEAVTLFGRPLTEIESHLVGFAYAYGQNDQQAKVVQEMAGNRARVEDQEFLRHEIERETEKEVEP